MARSKEYRDLIVWQKAMALARQAYALTAGLPKGEAYGLLSQIRRAAVSVPSNIAEGQGRLSVGEFKQFLGIARGSNVEVQTQLEIARAPSFGESALTDEAEKLSHKVGKMIYALLGSI